MWSGCNIITPNKFLNYFYKGKYFIIGEQNDTNEFIKIFLDKLNTELSKDCLYEVPENINKEFNDSYIRTYKNALENWAKTFNNKRSIISDSFYGQSISQITCGNCNIRTHNFEVFNDIIFNINGNEKEIYECFNNFYKRENLNVDDEDNKWTCDHCKKCVDSQKVIYNWKIPKILILCFKRYDIELKKINNLIKFPINGLDISNYCIGQHNKNKTKDYNLFGIINHYGTYDCGHYTSFGKNPNNNKWYKFDDSNVSEILDENNLITKNAYCLFYKNDSTE
jgi:ubiquitin C-terminal hydrolase